MSNALKAYQKFQAYISHAQSVFVSESEQCLAHKGIPPVLLCTFVGMGRFTLYACDTARELTFLAMQRPDFIKSQVNVVKGIQVQQFNLD